MENLTIPAGDYGYALPFSVFNYAGQALDLTPYSVYLKYWRKGNPDSPLLNGLCVIDDAVGGLCHYTIASGNFVTPGNYVAELELTATGIVESTESFEITIMESA